MLVGLKVSGVSDAASDPLGETDVKQRRLAKMAKIRAMVARDDLLTRRKDMGKTLLKLFGVSLRVRLFDKAGAADFSVGFKQTETAVHLLAKEPVLLIY